MVVDESGSIGLDNFKKIQRFLSEVVTRFSVSRFETHFAVVEYSTKASVSIQLNKYTNVQLLQLAIRRLRYKKGATYTGAALRLLKTKVSVIHRSNRFIILD